MSKKQISLTALLFSALLLLASCSSSENLSQATVEELKSCNLIDTGLTVQKGEKSDLTLQCLDGSGEVNFASIRGPAVVPVWASWCTNCKSQIPTFQRLDREGKNKVHIVGVDVEEGSIEKGQKFARENGLRWPHLFDPDGRSVPLFGPGVPVTLFVNEVGEITYQKIGAITEYEEMKTLIKTYLKVSI